MRPSKKRTRSLQSNKVEVHWCFRFLCCFRHWMSWICAWHYEIWRLPKNSGAQCRAQGQKADLGQRSWVWPNAYFKKHSKWFKTRCRRVLKWPAMSPDLIPIEHLWRDLKQQLGEGTLQIWKTWSSWQKSAPKFQKRGVNSLIVSASDYFQLFFFQTVCYQIISCFFVCCFFFFYKP